MSDDLSRRDSGPVVAGDEGDTLTLVAIPLRGARDVRLVPATRSRDWLAGSFGRSARRCLPLMVANQAGWVLLNPASFTVTWNGEQPRGRGLSVEYEPGTVSYRPVADSFGNGVVSFRVPYLFRTPPGWNLLIRGPSNEFKDAIAPMEGLVETDWAVATFTMNWKITRVDTPITFAAGEPYCMVVPQRRGELERFRPVLEPASQHDDIRAHSAAWSANRRQQLINNILFDNGYEPTDQAAPDSLQYLCGVYPDGSRPSEHQTQLRLREFERLVADGARSEPRPNLTGGNATADRPIP